jgi:hypothetical protein
MEILNCEFIWFFFHCQGSELMWIQRSTSVPSYKIAVLLENTGQEDTRLGIVDLVSDRLLALCMAQTNGMN